VGDSSAQSRARRALLMLAPAALAGRFLSAQINSDNPPGPPDDTPRDTRLPNGKKQQDAILAADYQQNLKDARDLIDLAKSFELDLEKEDRYVLSVSSLKKLDDMEKLTKRIRSRLKHF
jgi:hypothetical protein